MSHSQNAAFVALLGVLEQRAKKNGKKSIVKSVLERLVDAGADGELILEISALRSKKPAALKAAAPAKTPRKSTVKAIGKGKAGPAEREVADAVV